MPENPTTGYADRLSEALQRGPHPMSVRALARQIATAFPDLRGTSYGGIRQYAAGSVRRPRTELLQAIAEILGVRRDWLAFGEGAMTDKEENARQVSDRVTEASSMAELVVAEVEAGFGSGGDRLLSISPVRAAISHSWRTILVSRYGERLWQGDAHRLGVALGRALRSGLDELSVGLDEVSDDALTEYAISVCQGLRHLAGERAPPTPSIKGQDGRKEPPPE
jgi:hypothetical protein